MTPDELFFFNTKPDALPLYATLAERMLAAFPNVTVEVRKTQITFRERYGFAFVSLRKMTGCPEVFIIVSFGLSHRLDSPRIHTAVEPYPYANPDSSLLYGGFYHLCGTLLSGESAWIPTSSTSSYWEENRAFPVTDGFRISFQQKYDLLEKDFPLPALQLELSANIPWVLSEENPWI